jgi:hypothetical protein
LRSSLRIELLVLYFLNLKEPCSLKSKNYRSQWLSQNM